MNYINFKKIKASVYFLILNYFLLTSCPGLGPRIGGPSDQNGNQSKVTTDTDEKLQVSQDFNIKNDEIVIINGITELDFGFGIDNLNTIKNNKDTYLNLISFHKDKYIYDAKAVEISKLAKLNLNLPVDHTKDALQSHKIGDFHVFPVLGNINIDLNTISIDKKLCLDIFKDDYLANSGFTSIAATETLEKEKHLHLGMNNVLYLKTFFKETLNNTYSKSNIGKIRITDLKFDTKPAYIKGYTNTNQFKWQTAMSKVIKIDIDNSQIGKPIVGSDDLRYGVLLINTTNKNFDEKELIEHYKSHSLNEYKVLEGDDNILNTDQAEPSNQKGRFTIYRADETRDSTKYDYLDKISIHQKNGDDKFDDIFIECNIKKGSKLPNTVKLEIAARATSSDDNKYGFPKQMNGKKYTAIPIVYTKKKINIDKQQKDAKIYTIGQSKTATVPKRLIYFKNDYKVQCKKIVVELDAYAPVYRNNSNYNNGRWNENAKYDYNTQVYPIKKLQVKIDVDANIVISEDGFDKCEKYISGFIFVNDSYKEKSSEKINKKKIKQILKRTLIKQIRPNGNFALKGLRSYQEKFHFNKKYPYLSIFTNKPKTITGKTERIDFKREFKVENIKSYTFDTKGMIIPFVIIKSKKTKNGWKYDEIMLLDEVNYDTYLNGTNNTTIDSIIDPILDSPDDKLIKKGVIFPMDSRRFSSKSVIQQTVVSDSVNSGFSFYDVKKYHHPFAADTDIIKDDGTSAKFDIHPLLMIDIFPQPDNPIKNIKAFFEGEDCFAGFQKDNVKDNIKYFLKRTSQIQEYDSDKDQWDTMYGSTHSLPRQGSIIKGILNISLNSDCAEFNDDRPSEINSAQLNNTFSTHVKLDFFSSPLNPTTLDLERKGHPNGYKGLGKIVDPADNDSNYVDCYAGAVLNEDDDKLEQFCLIKFTIPTSKTNFKLQYPKIYFPNHSCVITQGSIDDKTTLLDLSSDYYSYNLIKQNDALLTDEAIDLSKIKELTKTEISIDVREDGKTQVNSQDSIYKSFLKFLSSDTIKQGGANSYVAKNLICDGDLKKITNAEKKYAFKKLPKFCLIQRNKYDESGEKKTTFVEHKTSFTNGINCTPIDDQTRDCVITPYNTDNLTNEQKLTFNNLKTELDTHNLVIISDITKNNS